MTTQSTYPVSVEGTLDETLNRWLWLIKWLLIIPHIVVLAFLWVGFVLVSIAAFFSILFTGRYPPFSLTTRDYPANLEVEYPEHLSRGLVLIKWWLLAIPHYVVVSFFHGGSGQWSGGGLTGVLAIFAAVGLLFTGRYPRDIFELIMGFNRWSFRVLAYAALMRDEYPPQA